MKKRRLNPLKPLIFACLIMLCIPSVQAADGGNDDAIMNMLPENCSFCLRINNFSVAMGKLDTYLSGISPMPLAMIVNMQLAGIIGDPMMGGLDLTGNAAFFVMPAPEGGPIPVAMGVLFPVTDYDQFIQNNPNCTKGADGITVLSSANSPVGNLVIMPALGKKHALVMPENMKPALQLAQKAMMNRSAKRLSMRLTPAQMKEAASAPAWAYVNIAFLYDQYKDDVMAGLDQMQSAVGEEAGATAAFGLAMYAEMFKAFAGDADSLTISLNPDPSLLKLDFGLRAKDGSDLADMLAADPKAAKSFKLGGYLDKASAINGLMKVNRPLFEKLNDKFLTIMADTSDDASLKKQTDSMKSMLKTFMDNMGNEISFSFSYAAGMPPIVVREVFDVKGDDFFGAMATEGMDYANAMYKAMELPMTLEYNKAVDTYKGVKIDSVSFDMKMDMPATETNPEMQAAFEQMNAMGNFKYYVAQSGKKAFLSMGAGSDTTIKSLIDLDGSAPVPADFKVALDTLEKSAYSDFVCSVNVITLMKGLGEMMASMGEQSGMQMPDIFGGLNVETKSSMAIGGYVDAGNANMRIALPKQHLMEIFSAVMQIQQQMMQSQMQMQQQMQGNMNATPEAAEAQNPLSDWIGKPAPDMKMVDLEGKIQRVSRLKGKKVVLDFWATWCPPCKEAIPHLIELRKNTKESELVLMGLSDEPIDRLNKFIKENKINYPIVSYNDDLPSPYGDVTGLPTMFLIDSKGVIRDVLVGFHPPEDVQAKLDNMK